MPREMGGNKERRDCMDNKFIRAEEVAQELCVSKPYAYKLIKKLNDELKQKGLSRLQGVSTASILRKGSTEQERGKVKCQYLRMRATAHGM